MSDELVIKHCAATLAGIKTGSMFCCEFENDQDLTESLCRLNHILSDRNLRAIPLRYSTGGGRAMIYIYIPSKLGQVVEDAVVSKLLKDAGYSMGSPNQCLAQLIKRLKGRSEEDFPHEIGLFLGYPPEDVKGFIDNCARDCKYCGAWKVYGDVEKAKTKFELYKKCRDASCECWKQSNSLEKAISAARRAALN